MSRLAALAAMAALLVAAKDGDDPLAGYAPAGPPVRCVGDFNVSPVVLDNHRIGLRQTGRRWWVSEIDHCPALQPFTTLIVERYGSTLCDTDRFRVLEPQAIIPSAYCRFGAFQPYERVGKRR